MNTEVRYAEVRAEGSGLSGVVLRYSDEYRIRGNAMELVERIEPGAFGQVEGADVVLNFQHDRAQPLARTNGGGMTLTDSKEQLSMRAEVSGDPDFERVLTKVRNRVMRGLSVEFTVDKGGEIVRQVGNRVLRTVKAATLRAIGVVDSPAYPESTVEARQRVDEICHSAIPTAPLPLPVHLI